MRRTIGYFLLIICGLLLSLRLGLGAPAAAGPEAAQTGASKAKADARRAKAKGRAKAQGKAKAKAKAKAKGGSGVTTGPAAVASKGDRRIAQIEGMLRSRRYREALPIVRKALQEAPDDADLHAALLLICDNFGESSCASSAARLSIGSTLIPVETLRARANALRSDGEGRLSAELRSTMIWELAGDLQLARVYALMARDLTEVGALEPAWEAMRMAETIAPDSSDVQFAEVENALLIGDLDEAEFRMWRGRLDGSFEGAELTEAELALGLAAQDLLLTAPDPTKPAWRHRARAGLTALRARARLLHGEPELAEDGVERLSFKLWGETYHPELVLAEAAVQRAQGDEAGAAETLDRLAHLAPRHPDWRRWGQAPPR
jgi:hypothetical protein